MKLDVSHILVIDDEVGMREGIKRIFQPQGMVVETAATGREGIEKGSLREYDLYFIDLRIGDLDGSEVLGAIKAKYPDALCIIITGFASIETAIETTRLGAYYYVSKPFMPDEIKLLVQRALERRADILETRRLREEEGRRLLEIAREKSRIRTIINTIDDGVLVINQQGEVAFFNPRFLSLLDIQAEVKIGQSVFGQLPDTLVHQIDEILQKKETLRAIRQEIIIHPPARLVVMSSTTPILDEKDELIGVVSVLRDISEIKQLELVKSQFVNMAAHELKAPLTAIQGYLEMVIGRSLGDAEETYGSYLQRSLERTRSLIQLINDLLNLSRMQTGKVRRDIERVDLAALIKQIVDFFANEIKSRELFLDCQIESPLWADVDREEMQRVFTNLISNAIKYNRQKGRIGISGQLERHFVRVAISDTGIGMRPEEKERLFEEFFRAKNPHTRQISGTGLGLSIVKKTIDAYAGRITVESEYDKGSCFTVYLPDISKPNQ